MTLRMGTRILAARPFVTVVTGVLLIAFLGLGFWQLERMREKQALFDAFAAGTLETHELTEVSPGPASRYRHVVATGRYDAAHQVLLDNMTHAGSAGYRVLTPFDYDGRTILVDRGWMPLGATRETLPDVTVNEEVRRVAGRLAELPAAGIELPADEASAAWPRVLSFPRQSELSAALERPIDPQIILLDPDQPDGYLREWRPSTFPPERHLGYAITWFALAATLVTLFVVTNLRRVPEQL